MGCREGEVKAHGALGLRRHPTHPSPRSASAGVARPFDLPLRFAFGAAQGERIELDDRGEHPK